MLIYSTEQVCKGSRPGVTAKQVTVLLVYFAERLI